MAVLIGCSAAIALTDLTRRKIPNWIVLITLGGGILYHLIPFDGRGLAEGLLTAVGVFVVLLALYALGGIHAGDVKYLTAVAVWLGFKGTLLATLLGVVIAIAAASLILIKQGRFFRYITDTLWRLRLVPSALLHRREDTLILPIGACFAVGVICIALMGGGDLIWESVVAKL